MNFDWSEEQKKFQKKLATFAVDQLRDDVTHRDRVGEFSHELWKRCAVFGVQGMNVPFEYGGGGRLDVLSCVGGMEQLGYGCIDSGLLLALSAQMWSVQWPIVEFGSAQVKEQTLRRLCSGEWKGAHAMTEEVAGSDARGIETTAEPCTQGYRLNGAKWMVTLAPIADVFLVTAKIRDGGQPESVATFVVTRECGGVTTSEADEKMGLRTVPFGRIELTNCCVPASHRLESNGLTLTQQMLDMERCCILAAQVGAMKRQLEETIRFVRQRRQFGQSIGGFQSISNRIADMRLRLETSRLLLHRVAWLKSQRRSASAECSMLKLHVSEAAYQSSQDAMRIHGGRGYMTETGVERELRDSFGALFYAGTSDIQRNIIAAMAGVG